MAALIIEACLSASVENLLARITSDDFQDFLRNKKLNVSLFSKLKSTLLALSAVLNDAEEKQISNPIVQEWVDELKDAIFDTEDLLDKINTDSLQSKLEVEPQNVTNQVWNFLSSPFSQFYREMNSKMEGMCQRLEYFAKQKDIIGLQSVTGKVFYKAPTTSLVNESVMVGRKEETEKLIKLLLSDEDANGDKIGVVTILGMGGVGKTTLAQLLYNDKEVQEHFDIRAWVCVSEKYDAFMVTKALLESLTSNSKVYTSINLDCLQIELKQHLRDKKFLFVLDDLWNDKYNDWVDLLTPFTSARRGSKIVVTTRQRRVAEVTHTFPIHKCDPLSDEDCWSLLAKHAFRSGDSKRYQELEAISRKIAKKCSGLPIAAKTLGGLLRSKVDAKEWNVILNSNIWDLPNDEVLPALHLSYLYLPAQLKRCFAYCSIFPKGCLLEKKQLVLLWMAAGLGQQSRGEKTMEKMGEDYFDELLSRSLIHQPKYVNERNFVMHDLVNDLARVVAGKTCFRQTCFKLEDDEISKSVRHLSYLQEEYENYKKFEFFHELKYLRTFLPMGFKGYNLAPKVPQDLLPLLKCLRVLSLSGYKNVTQLPDSIGNLVHLRYLDLSNTGIQRLPDTICRLYNLQTLILLGCESLTELPKEIGKLVDLRHINISRTNLKEMPVQIKELHNLQTLTTFIVGRQEDGLRVRELRNFAHLQGNLSILKLQNVLNVMDAYEANLKNKDQIEGLELEWGCNCQDSRTEKDVLEHLQPSTKLRELSIRFYGGTSFPSWLGDKSFSSMVTLDIIECNYCLSLPPLGQLPSLKKLVIARMEMVKTVGAEFYGGNGSCSFQPFPALEELTFSKMSDWEEWLPFDGEGIEFPFPCLKILCLDTCPKLKRYLPHRLPSSFTRVEIWDCYELEASAPCWIHSIEFIDITNGGPSLLPIFDDALQCSLQAVHIEKWDSLQSLPGMILSSNCLQSLHLHDISSLTSFPTQGLPQLQKFTIWDCPNLEFPPTKTWHNYKSLKELIIQNSCHSLNSIQLGCFPVLKHLEIADSPNLTCLSISEEASSQSLSCLETVHISFCPKLGEAGLHFQHLTSLSHLSIGGDDLVDALLKKPLLPTSLVSLGIIALSHIRFLRGDGLQHLNSLLVLGIGFCSRLESLPEYGLPSSLKQLRICKCPMLQSLPENSLPPSLSLLEIEECPLLEARYQSQREKHWHKIAHIPAIKINEQVIL